MSIFLNNSQLSANQESKPEAPQNESNEQSMESNEIENSNVTEEQYDSLSNEEINSELINIRYLELDETPEPEVTHTQQEKSESGVIEHDSFLKALLEQLKPINFMERAGLSDGEKLSKQHEIIISVEEVLDVAIKNKWAMSVSNGFVYYYNGAFWKQMTKKELEHFLGKAAEILGVDTYEARYFAFRVELVKQFLTSAFMPRPVRIQDEVLVNLLNGTFVITKDSVKLREFRKDDFLTYQLPFAYDEKVEAPLFQKYLSRVLPDTDQQKVLAEFMGYVFVKQKTLKLEKSLILYGGGANGKSVFFDIITSMFGPHNVSNFSLNSLTNGNGYFRAKLDSKLLNYASEISPNMDSTLFKQMVSGEPIEARLPYGEPFVLEDYAKMVFNTNELPRDVEQNEAFFRRFLILHFSVTIPEGERNPSLANDIIEAELSGVFNWVLDGLKRLLEQRNFTASEAVKEMVRIYRQQSDSVQLFLGDMGYVKDVTKERALKVMYNEYRDYSRDNGYKAVSNRNFSERLKNQGFELTRKKNGNVVDAQKNVFPEPALPAPASPKKDKQRRNSVASVANAEV